jgi:ATP-dependent RNA helicase SUPV3L1/SUV3
LKPAARALASLLWAQKQDDVDLAALSNAQHMASSGRTSFPVDKQLVRDAYRLLGYRQCGERAVRVDILERLADLIRPALAWRATSPGEKPAGAFDGRGFVVTQAMTSLTGSAGEDFASILRALGYRMDRRPPLPPKPVAAAEPVAAEVAPAVEPVAGEAAPEGETVAAEAAPVEAGAETATAVEAPQETVQEAAQETLQQTAQEILAETETAAPPVSRDRVPSASLLPEVLLAPAAPEAAPAAAEAVPAESEAPSEAVAPLETHAAEAPEEQAAAEAPSESAVAGETITPAEAAAAPEAATATPEAAAAALEAAAAPELIDVWRPGGRADERRPRHERHRHRHQQAPQEGAQAPAAAGEAVTGAGEKRERHRHGRRDRLKDFGKPREAAPAEVASAPAEGAPAGERREDKGRPPPRERFEGKGFEGKGFEGKGRDRDKEKGKGKFGGDREHGGRDRGRDKGGRDKRDSGPSHRQYATSASPRDRDRPIDPNSPFAKLAALKEQLTANRKD